MECRFRSVNPPAAGETGRKHFTLFLDSTKSPELTTTPDSVHHGHEKNHHGHGLRTVQTIIKDIFVCL